MSEILSLANSFLIAMPNLADPNFSKTVTYIFEHTPDGVIGITINRPLDLTLGEILGQTQTLVTNRRYVDQIVHVGGPVEGERGFVLHSADSEWASTLKVSGDLAVTTSSDILEALGQGDGPSSFFVALGYAGWSAQQLEDEIAENVWLTCPADTNIIFDVPADERWQAAADRIGVDLSLLFTEAGHA